jgi:hypothetical protein
MTDYAELVERLRFGIDHHNVVYGWQADCLVAADAIEALVKERDEMRDRAEKAEAANLDLDRRFHYLAGGPEALDCGKSMVEVMAELAAARKALEQDCTGCIHAPERDGDTYDEECMGCRRFYADGFAAARAEGGE